MRILITNDDGINAAVLPLFIAWAKKLGEVTVVVPKEEQSGMSQAIDFHRTSEIKRVELVKGCECWTMDSTPADCVRFAAVGLRRTYDLVLSGINRGFNLGHDIVYSGTVGAIFEAARLGIKAMAFSTDMIDFQPSLKELDPVYGYIMEKDFLSHADLLNVNFPARKSKGICITKQGGEFYSDAFVCQGDDRYVQVGEPVYQSKGDLTVDIDAVLEGYVSVTPLTADRTDSTAYTVLKKL